MISTQRRVATGRTGTRLGRAPTAAPTHTIRIATASTRTATIRVNEVMADKETFRSRDSLHRALDTITLMLMQQKAAERSLRTTLVRRKRSR